MSKILKFLNVGGENYNIGYSSNDYTASDKSNLERLIDKNFPLKVTLSAFPTSSASSALNGAGSNVPKDVKISWTLKYEGNSSNEDASQYEGTLTLKYGGKLDTINLGKAEMGVGYYTASLSTTTTITLTVNGKTGSTTVYFAKPMYSGVLPVGETFDNLSALSQIKPIATTISNMGNQTIEGLSVDYVYWIAIPDNLEIKKAVLPDALNADFDMMEVDSPASGYRLYRSGKTEADSLVANSIYKVKFS